MGSGCEAAQETLDALCAQGEKVGLLKVRLYRPFSVESFTAALPNSVKAIAVLDRTKEPGSIGEPLYQDIVTGLTESVANGASSSLCLASLRPLWHVARSVSGECKAVFDELKKAQPKHFTVGSRRR